MTTSITLENLAHFYGTENWYRHWLGGLVYTDGMHFLEKNGAAWLIDLIASHQPDVQKDREAYHFQVWKLKKEGDGCVVTCQSDSESPVLVSQEIEYTDFPLDEFTIWAERGYINGDAVMICMLPSER